MSFGWMDIQPGMQVLEVGAGSGVFTIEAAKAAGPDGRVHAADIQPAMIAKVERNVQQAGLGNVETKLASAYELPLPDESIDRAYLITVLCEIPDRQRATSDVCHKNALPLRRCDHYKTGLS